jgi:hypothetical protein
MQFAFPHSKSSPSVLRGKADGSFFKQTPSAISPFFLHDKIESVEFSAIFLFRKLQRELKTVRYNGLSP